MAIIQIGTWSDGTPILKNDGRTTPAQQAAQRKRQLATNPTARRHASRKIAESLNQSTFVPMQQCRAAQHHAPTDIARLDNHMIAGVPAVLYHSPQGRHIELQPQRGVHTKQQVWQARQIVGRDWRPRTIHTHWRDENGAPE